MLFSFLNLWLGFSNGFLLKVRRSHFYITVIDNVLVKYDCYTGEIKIAFSKFCYNEKETAVCL